MANLPDSPNPYGAPAFPPSAEGVPQESSRAGLALALSIISWACCGIFLSIPALLFARGEIRGIREQRRPPGGLGMAQAAFWVALANIVLTAAMVPVLALTAIPNFIHFQTRAKQPEAKANLKAAFVAERAYYEEKDAYSPNVSEVGFVPERGNRYAYLFDSKGHLSDRSGAVENADPAATGVDMDRFKWGALPPLSPDYLTRTYAGGAKLGVTGSCPKCDIVMVAVGNIDNDPTLDVWSIATFERTGPKGEVIPAGELFNDVNDVAE
jgi:type IV pilus assembly protein PilA